MSQHAKPYTNRRLVTNHATPVPATPAPTLPEPEAPHPHYPHLKCDECGTISFDLTRMGEICACPRRGAFRLHTVAPVPEDREEATTRLERVLDVADATFDLRRANSRLEDENKRLRAFAKDVATNYDHEEQTREHRKGYGGSCRVCSAEKALAAAAHGHTEGANDG